MTAYDFPTAFSAWDAAEDAAIARVRKSGRYTSGPEVEAFEDEFARFHGMRHGIMINSGSSANLVATAALFHVEGGLKPGDKAIVPAIAWSTTYAPLVQMGLDLVVADVDETWNAYGPITPGQPMPRLAIGCSILGNPASCLPFLPKLADYTIEDNAESLGATLDGKLTGTFGHLNTFSFFHSHQLSAIEGGMILTDSDELNRLCRLLRNHGNAGFLTPNPTFAQSYDFRLMGYNLRGLELHAAIGRAQLSKLHVFKYERLRNLRYFENAVAGLPVACQRRTQGGAVARSPFGLAFEVEDATRREPLVQALRQASIDCRLPTGGSFLKHFYAKKWSVQSTPRADKVHTHGLFLGCAPWDISEKIDKAVQVMKTVL